MCPGSLTVRLGAPKIWLNRNVGFTPCMARVPPIVAGSQGNCLSFFWFSLGVALDLRRVVSSLLSLGMLLTSMGLFSTSRNIDCLSQLKPDKIF